MTTDPVAPKPPDIQKEAEGAPGQKEVTLDPALAVSLEPLADDNPVVSIVTVVLNGAEHLEQTIQSVLSQDYPNIEYLILDGGSTDGTLAIIERYRSRLAYFHSKPDKGIYDAMNQGIALATGQIIGLKNADDWFAPGAISQVVRTWKETGADVVYGDTGMVWQDRPLRWSFFPSDHRLLPKGQGIDHRNMFVTRRVYALEKYDTRYRISADHDLMMRLWSQGIQYAHTGMVLGFKRGGGFSANPRILEELLDINLRYIGEKAARALYKKQKRKMRLQSAKNRILRTVFGKEGFARFKARNSAGDRGPRDA